VFATPSAKVPLRRHDQPIGKVAREATGSHGQNVTLCIGYKSLNKRYLPMAFGIHVTIHSTVFPKEKIANGIGPLNVTLVSLIDRPEPRKVGLDEEHQPGEAPVIKLSSLLSQSAVESEPPTTPFNKPTKKIPGRYSKRLKCFYEPNMMFIFEKNADGIPCAIAKLVSVETGERTTLTEADVEICQRNEWVHS
jgi:hypothetical protein